MVLPDDLFTEDKRFRARWISFVAVVYSNLKKLESVPFTSDEKFSKDLCFKGEILFPFVDIFG